MNGSSLQRFPKGARRALAALLGVAAAAYIALLVSTYFKLTAPSSFVPDQRDLSAALFDTSKPMSQVERLLTSTSGEMTSGGTMRPAFTEQSEGWTELTAQLSPDALNILREEREGERLALLDWIRSGASAVAYEQDNYPIADPASIRMVTEKYRYGDASATAAAPMQVKIRSLINDRCVTCHGENGRHDTARFIELDTYERLARRLQPEPSAPRGRPWVLAAFVWLYPLTAITAPLFFSTSHSLTTRASLVAVALVALCGIPVFWLCGSEAAPLLLAAAFTAAFAVLAQNIACLQELLSRQLL